MLLANELLRYTALALRTPATMIVFLVALFPFAARAQTALTNLPTSGSISNVAVNPLTNKIFVADYTAGELRIFDGAGDNASPIATVITGNSSRNLLVNPVTNRIYIANVNAGAVHVIDGFNIPGAGGDGNVGIEATLVFGLGATVRAMKLDILNQRLYVVTKSGMISTLRTIDAVTHAETAQLELSADGATPLNMNVDPVHDRAYVWFNSGYWKIDTAANTILAPSGPFNYFSISGLKALVIDAAADRLYVATSAVANTGTLQTYTLSTGGYVGANALGGTALSPMVPEQLAINVISRKIYVGYNTHAAITAIDIPSGNATSIPSGQGVFDMLINPAANQLLVASGFNDTYTQIDGATAASTVSAPGGIVGQSPRSIAFNTGTNRVYVSHNGGVRVVKPNAAPTPAPLTVSISSLPANTTTNSAPTINFNTVSGYTPAVNAPAIRAIYYQVDGTSGKWLRATGAASASATLAPLALGGHTIFAFAIDDLAVVQNATGGTTSFGHTPFTGQLASYAFTVENAPALSLVAVQSRKPHGTPAVLHDWPINIASPITGNVSVEPRLIGAGHTIVFQFNGPITSLGSASAVDSASNPIGSATSAFSGNEIRVKLVGMPDHPTTRATISVIGVNGILNSSVSMGFLAGDINHSRTVNASDISAVKAHVGQNVTAANFQYNLDGSGVISEKDVVVAKSRSGLTLAQ